MTDPRHLSADQENAIANAYFVQRMAREVFGPTRQDLKIIEECTELTQALARRLGHYELGGKRGDIEGELADALFTILGAMPADSWAWDILRSKTERLKAMIEGKR